LLLPKLPQLLVLWMLLEVGSVMLVGNVGRVLRAA
jgi:hypothetical protein